jgi:hypothetical protein
VKATFKVFVGKDIPPEHPTFEAAFAVFFTQMLALVRAGTSLQMVETGCWIEGAFELTPGGKRVSAPLYFYDARDFAYDVGLLVDEGGRAALADPAPSVDLSVVSSRFVDSGRTSKRDRDGARAFSLHKGVVEYSASLVPGYRFRASRHREAFLLRNSPS